MVKLIRKILIASLLLPALSSADPIMCDEDGRSVTVDDGTAIACSTTDKNPKKSDVNDWIDPDDEEMDLMEIAEVDGDSSTSDWLSITLNDGDFWDDDDDNVYTGMWTLAAGFWDQVSQAVLTFHVGGQGGGSGFMIQLAPGEYSGMFTIDASYGRGGGLSNAKLFAVPEPSTLALFGLGLLGIGMARRRKANA